jgi:hypothetical protein
VVLGAFPIKGGLLYSKYFLYIAAATTASKSKLKAIDKIRDTHFPILVLPSVLSFWSSIFSLLPGNSVESKGQPSSISIYLIDVQSRNMQTITQCSYGRLQHPTAGTVCGMKSKSGEMIISLPFPQ